MTKRETHKRTEAELTEVDRNRIAHARDVLKSYSEEYQFDTPDPLTELGYEQRMARGRALELAVQAGVHAIGGMQVAKVPELANIFYEFIWEGKTDA